MVGREARQVNESVVVGCLMEGQLAKYPHYTQVPNKVVRIVVRVSTGAEGPLENRLLFSAIYFLQGATRGRLSQARRSRRYWALSAKSRLLSANQTVNTSTVAISARAPWDNNDIAAMRAYSPFA
jgi:hypothetical protein